MQTWRRDHFTQYGTLRASEWQPEVHKNAAKIDPEGCGRCAGARVRYELRLRLVRGKKYPCAQLLEGRGFSRAVQTLYFLIPSGLSAREESAFWTFSAASSGAPISPTTRRRKRSASVRQNAPKRQGL